MSQVALERLRDPADPVPDWNQVRHDLLCTDCTPRDPRMRDGASAVVDGRILS